MELMPSIGFIARENDILEEKEIGRKQDINILKPGGILMYFKLNFLGKAIISTSCVLGK